jgi:putative transposase
VVTHESIRHWCLKFGEDFARKLRRRRSEPGDAWHLDEVLILSVNSGGMGEGGEARHPRPGTRQAI